MIHLVVFYKQIDPTLIENARIVFLQIFNQRRSGLPTDILLPLDHFETNTIRTITQDMFGWTCVYIGATTTWTVKFLNNNMQFNYGSRLIVLDPHLALEIKLVQFIRFHLLLDGLLEEFIDRFVFGEYLLQKQLLPLP